MKKQCKACKKEIDAKASKCPHCGTDQRNWFIQHKIITGVLVFILLVAVGGAAGSSNKNSTSSSSSNNTTSSDQGQSKQNQPTPTPDSHPHFGDGTYVVGKDIKPGTYRTRVGSSGCYYERLSGFGGSLGEIIANDNTDYPAIVTIDPTDKGFKSQDCGTWTQDISQITKSKTTFPDGMYIVGTDIQPGTYKNSGQASCYYSRLSNFSDAGTDGIISNDNTDNAAIVTIDSTDAGFKSSSCGTWTLQQ